MMPEQALMKMLIHTASDSCCIHYCKAQQMMAITRLDEKAGWCVKHGACSWAQLIKTKGIGEVLSK